MIKRFIRRVLGLPSESLQRVPRERHGLASEAISPSAAKVCAALREAGFSAYVVGGAVRDLLLGIAPKDFDIATDARPEQIRPLFRRALIIGRRFRLVHVILGGDTVEVSTFRGADTSTAEKDEHGRVLRDNVFGTQEEDARRRDFTVNALYQLGKGFEVAASVFGRQGYARPVVVTVDGGDDGPLNALAVGTVDAFRNPNVFDVDFRLAKTQKIGGSASLQLTADLFNAFNSGVILAQNRFADANAFGNINEILSPRILRIGLRLQF